MTCIAACLLFISCGNSPLVSQLEGSDSIAIVFKQPATGSIIKVVGTSQPYAIKDMLRFAGTGETAPGSCGYDGNALFFKQGTIRGEVAFNYTIDGCRHFLLMVNGKPVATKMSYEAIDFLKGIAASKK